MSKPTRITNSIRALRFARGEMTQAELAQRIGVTRQTIIAIEQGRYSPSLEVAFQIAQVFKVPLDEVFQYPEGDSQLGDTVLAAVSRRYGPPDVVTVAEVPRPEPRDDEILVRVRAAAVGVVDGLARRGSPWYARAHFGPLRPRFPVLGCDFAGDVEAAGPAVSRFGVGEAVFGTIAPRFGAHAEYVCLPEHGAVAPKPANVSYAEAAALADATALCFLRDKAGLRAGQAVLVNGASGAVGSAAVQLARHFGATVTGVCSGPHLRLVRKLGAESVVDYTRTDFTRAGRRYDVIFDVAGTSSFGRCRPVLNPGGVYLTTAPSLAIFAAMPWTARFGARRAVVAFTGLRPAAEKQRDLLVIKELAEASALVPVVGACYPLARIADAYRHVDAGHKKGTIVVTVS